jgi:hypothetical protein
MRFNLAFAKNKPFEVVGMGLNSVDFLCLVPEFPTLDSKMEILQFSKQGGGQVATAMVALSRWGIRTKYIGKVGDDELGGNGNLKICQCCGSPQMPRPRREERNSDLRRGLPSTPLESPSIHGGDDINEVSIPLRKGGLKTLSFLTGSTLHLRCGVRPFDTTRQDQ